MVADLFVSGLVLLYLVERTLVATSNPNFVPSVILLGSFLVPITFLTYLYGRLPNWEVSLPAIAVCFLWGGVLGTVVARTLEYDVARALGFLPKFAIGIIEESAKLMVPLVFYFAGRGRERAYSPECVAGVFSEARIRHGEWGRGIGALRGYIGD